MNIHPQETRVLEALDDTYRALGGPNSPEAQIISSHGLGSVTTRALLLTPVAAIADGLPRMEEGDDILFDPGLFVKPYQYQAFQEGYYHRSMQAILEYSENDELSVRDVLSVGHTALMSINGVSAMGASIIGDQLKTVARFNISRYPQPEVMAYTHDKLAEVPATLSYIQNYTWRVRPLFDTTMPQLLDADTAATTEADREVTAGQQTAQLLGYDRRFMLSKVLYPYIAQRFGHQEIEQCMETYAAVMQAALDTGPEAAIASKYPDRNKLRASLETDMDTVREYAQTNDEKSACTLLKNITRSKYGDPEETSVRRMVTLGERWCESLPKLGMARARLVAHCVERATSVKIPELPSPELAAYVFDSLSDIPAHSGASDIRRGVYIRSCREGTMQVFPKELKSTKHELSAMEMQRDYFRAYRRRFLFSRLVYQELGVND